MNQRKKLSLSLLLSILLTWIVVCNASPQKKIIMTDFSKFHPASAISTEPVANKWYLRFVPWADKGGTVLNIGAGFPEEIHYDPKLKGRYDLYVGVHKVDGDSRFQIRVGSNTLLYTINVGKFKNKKYTKKESSKEVLYAKNIKMDGEYIALRCYGASRVYIDYLKFTPANPDSKLSDKYVKKEKGISIIELKKARASYIPPKFFGKKYRDTTLEPKINNNESKQGYIVFSRNYMYNIFPASIPRREEINKPLKTFASLGEYEPISFAIRASKNLEKVKITVSKLENADGSAIPASNIDIQQVGMIRKRSRFYRAREYMNVPLILEKRTSYSILKNVSTCFWATVKVPNKELPYGNYKGTIKISPANAPAYKLPLTLKVLPFKLEEPDNLYIAANDIATLNHLGSEDFLNEKFRDMRAHGMTSITWWFEDFKLKLKFNKNKVKVVFDGKSSLEKVMNAYKNVGFPCKRIFVFMGRQLENITRRKGGKENFEKFYKQIIQQIIAEGKKRGWPQLILCPVDEAASHGDLPMAALMTKLTKEAGATTGATSLPLFPRNDLEKKYVPQILKYADILNNGFSLNNKWNKAELEDVFKRAKKLKKTLYSYNINNALQMPEMTSYRFSTGYFFLTIGKPIKGQCIYMYNYISDSPYNDLDGIASDNMLVYPSDNALDRPGGPTVCWEAVREGVDDYKYIYTLNNCIGKILAVSNPEYSGARDMANEAKGKLHKILNSFNFTLMRKTCRQRIESTWDKTGFNYVEGKYLLRNSWDYEDYQKNREIIADEILKLMAVMPTD